MNKLPYKLFLAPMAELTTPAFRKEARKLCQNFVAYSEMLSAASIVSNGTRNKCMMTKLDNDDPVAYQILGCDPDIMRGAVELLNDYNLFAVDINMGCSAPDIIKRGYGAKLLTDIKLSEKIITACRISCKTKLSVKLRIAWENYDEKYFLDFCKMIMNSGADFITIHGRTAKLAFKRKADWLPAQYIKSSLVIPVIGNGDIITASDAHEKLGSLDAVMIGRAAIQKPWIFGEISNPEYMPEITDKFIVQTGLNILQNIKELMPYDIQKNRASKFLFYFTKNFHFGHNLFKTLNNQTDIDNIINCYNDYFADK